jgi:hypothetical protein
MQTSLFAMKEEIFRGWLNHFFLTEREFHVPLKRDAHASCKVLPDE